MKKLKILLAALLVIGSTAKAQVVMERMRRNISRHPLSPMAELKRKTASHSFPDKRNISYPV